MGTHGPGTAQTPEKTVNRFPLFLSLSVKDRTLQFGKVPKTPLLFEEETKNYQTPELLTLWSYILGGQP